MKKINALVLGLAVLVTVGCSKNDEQVLPAANNNNGSAQKCQLVEMDYTEGTNVTNTTLTYNAAGQVTKITTKENGQVTESAIVSYDAAGQVIKVTDSNNNYQTYEYNTDGLLVKKSEYKISGPSNAASLSRFYIYEYNSNKKLIKRTEYDPGQGNAILAYSNFSYPTPTTARLEGYTVNTGFALSYTHDYSYDDKVGLQGLLGVLGNHFGPFSNHNILTEKYNALFSSTVYNKENTFQYNANGYPTKQTTTVNGVQDPGVSTFTYNCQ